jgi:hypothetical protein
MYHTVRRRSTARPTLTSCVHCRHSNCYICKWLPQTFAIMWSKQPAKRFDVSSTLLRGLHKGGTRSRWPAASQMTRPPQITCTTRVVQVGLEIPTAVLMKRFIFWNIMPCSPLKINGRFGETCRLHIQDQRISQARNQNEAGSKQSKLKEAACSSETSLHFHWTTRISQKRDVLITIQFS